MVDFLVSVQNDVVAELPEVGRERVVPPESVTEVMLVPDVSDQFAATVAMYELTDAEMAIQRTSCRFSLYHIAAAVRGEG